MKKNISISDNTKFIYDRNTIRDFISRVRRVQYLANISAVSKSTVERTFKITSFDSLSGDMLTVWENAVKMYEDFELLKEKTKTIAELIRESDRDNS